MVVYEEKGKKKGWYADATGIKLERKRERKERERREKEKKTLA